MAEPEKRENSVLFSLRELQKLEEQRIDEEETAKRSAEEERIRTQMETERRRREEEEARRRASELESRQREDEHARHARELEARKHEAEMRARLEQQHSLEQQRMVHEMEAKKLEASKKRPTLLIGIAVVLVFLVGGLGYYLYDRDQKAQAAEKQAALEREEREKAEKESAELREQIVAINTQINDLTEAMKNANSDADRAEAQRKLDAARERLKNLEDRARRPGGGGGGGKKPPDNRIKINPKCITEPNHPDC